MDDPKLPVGEGAKGVAGDVPARSPGGPLGLILPPDKAVWNEARRLVADKDIRVEDLSICAAQDPIMVIDLLKVANAMFFAGGRSPITSTKTAIMRLGSDVVLETFDKMADRPEFAEESVRDAFEQQRNRCKRTSLLATILAEALTRTLSEDCQVAGLLLFVGEMLAVAHFKEEYVKLNDELSRSSVNYRLATDHKFDVERMGVSYLRRQGIPETILFAIDRDGRSRSPDRAVMKPICMAAGELCDAFDSNRWEKFAPGKTLPR